MKGFDRERRVLPPALPKKPLQASAAKGLKYKMGAAMTCLCMKIFEITSFFCIRRHESRRPDLTVHRVDLPPPLGFPVRHQ
jgi:hypothetical protein